MNDNEKLKKYKYIIVIFLISVAFFAVIATGERSNTIKFILSLIIFFILFDQITLKRKIVLFLTFIFVIYFTVKNDEYLKGRMFYSIQHSAKTFNSSFVHGKPWDNPSGNLYAKLYRSGFEVFKNYPYFGVGNKNYRIESCNNNKYDLNIHKRLNDYVCMTHPHQIYFELLSEHGFLGSIIILSIYFSLIFRMIKKVISEKNYIGVGCLAFLIPVFTPILPSGSFFSDFNSTLFFINLAVLYATSKSFNIFRNINNDK
ncbi:O-Antigen ligase [alpha proteobacterium HIMB5]|nr:O-Antigen ligase [alpha proteobacterium HIMB5]